MRRVRVLLVEDNRLFRETLELLLGLRAEIDVVGSAAGAAEALALCGELAPDVVVIDYRMPGLDGAQATRELLRASPSMGVLCLTASVTETERDLVLAAGAVACLTKDESLEAIVEAVLEAGDSVARR